MVEVGAEQWEWARGKKHTSMSWRCLIRLQRTCGWSEGRRNARQAIQWREKGFDINRCSTLICYVDFLNARIWFYDFRSEIKWFSHPHHSFGGRFLPCAMIGVSISLAFLFAPLFFHCASFAERLQSISILRSAEWSTVYAIVDTGIERERERKLFSDFYGFLLRKFP